MEKKQASKLIVETPYLDLGDFKHCESGEKKS